MGEIGILNVGTGDTKLVFDKNNPEDCARAARTLADMVRRGYVILIEVGKDPKNGEPLYQRVREFREDTCEYIIAGDADVSAAGATEGEANVQSSSAKAERKGRAQGRKAPRTRTVHASEARGISIPRSAGG